MTGSERTQLASELAREWSSRLRSAVEMMAQQQLTVTPGESSADAMAEAGDLLTLDYSFSHAPTSSMRVATPTGTSAGISKIVLASSGIEESDEALLKETWQEILAQAASGLAQDCGSRIGASVSAGSAVEGDGHAPEGYIASAELAIGEEKFPAVYLCLPWAFVEALHVENDALEVSAAAEVTPAKERGRELPPTLDLLLDVELPVSVSFGRTHLAVREVLKLATGSIIELDRPVNQFVEVVVNNCVIARGEVVVIEGNYGVRIHEIISRKDRMSLQHLGAQNPYQQARISA